MGSDYSYSFEWDTRYCYPNSNVLRNKLGITEEDALRTAEREITSFKMAAARVHGLPGKFDLDHLCNIHKYLFEDIYDWAGQLREVDIAKGNLFCHCSYIRENADKLFLELKEEGFLKGTDPADITKRFAYYLSEINVLHPFREGNGRSQRLFIELLAKEAGYILDFSLISPEEMIIASAEAFDLHYEKMDAIFEKVTSPYPVERSKPLKNKSIRDQDERLK